MKSKLTTLALLGLTIAAIAVFPGLTHGIRTTEPVVAQTDAPRRIDAVFVLDTTGSMGGLIQAAKQKIWAIASTLASEQSAPEIRIGLVAYRDRGDAYVTRVVELSSDLDSVYAELIDFQAQGGGDGPESVNQALQDAVHKMSWSPDQDAYKVIFLVGDAPPHMDYQDDVKYPQTLEQARKLGIVVNSIQCGSNRSATPVWQSVAQLGGGEYAMVEQSGNAVAISTPFDDKLAELSRQLDRTRLYYGSASQKAEKAAKVAATEKLNRAAPVESLARRATFNASTSGVGNLAGSQELVDDVENGRVELESVATEQLPESLKPMAPEKRAQTVRKTAQRRAELKQQIRQLSEKRGEYLKQRVAESGGAEESLDQKLFDAFRKQGSEKGLVFEELTY